MVLASTRSFTLPLLASSDFDNAAERKVPDASTLSGTLEVSRTCARDIAAATNIVSRKYDRTKRLNLAVRDIIEDPATLHHLGSNSSGGSRSSCPVSFGSSSSSS